MTGRTSMRATARTSPETNRRFYLSPRRAVRFIRLYPQRLQLVGLFFIWLVLSFLLIMQKPKRLGAAVPEPGAAGLLAGCALPFALGLLLRRQTLLLLLEPR